MADLATLKSRIATEIHRSSATADIAYAIADAVAEYQTHRFAFNQVSATFSTTAGTEYYGVSVIPTDIAQIDSLRITANGRTTVIEPRNWAEIDSISTTTSAQSRPIVWAWYKEQIRFYPVPDGTYTVHINYLQKLDVPSNDGASNAWTEEAEELIRQAAKAKYFTNVAYDIENANYASGQAQIQFRRLKRELQQLETGPLVGSM